MAQSPYDASYWWDVRDKHTHCPVQKYYEHISDRKPASRYIYIKIKVGIKTLCFVNPINTCSIESLYCLGNLCIPRLENPFRKNLADIRMHLQVGLTLKALTKFAAGIQIKLLLNTSPASVVCWKYLQTVWTQIRPDKVSGLIGPRSGPTKCRAWSGSKLFDTDGFPERMFWNL